MDFNHSLRNLSAIKLPVQFLNFDHARIVILNKIELLMCDYLTLMFNYRIRTIALSARTLATSSTVASVTSLTICSALTSNACQIVSGNAKSVWITREIWWFLSWKRRRDRRQENGKLRRKMTALNERMLSGPARRCKGCAGSKKSKESFR